jgi:hypothetical protein
MFVFVSTDIPDKFVVTFLKNAAQRENAIIEEFITLKMGYVSE